MDLCQTTTSNPVPEVLDQSDIDRLAGGFDRGSETGRVSRRRKATSNGGGIPKIETYDFRNPVFLAEADTAASSSAARGFHPLSFSTAVTFSADGVWPEDGKTHDTFPTESSRRACRTRRTSVYSRPTPCRESAFSMSILASRLRSWTGCWAVPASLHAAERYLTEIEVTLLEDIVIMILEEWCSQWKDAKELHPTVIGHESNGRFLQTSTKDAVVLTLTMEATFGECSEQIQIGIPYFTIEPLVRSLQASRQKEGTPAVKAQKAEWKPVYEHISLPVRAEWDAFELSLREVTELRVGDIIELPTGIVDRTTVKLNGSSKFSGTVGLDGETVVVKLTQKILPEHAPDSKHHGR
jgi:flagellar motor switch protein FliM